MTIEHVWIDTTFNGPSQSGHGGVSGGRFAALVSPAAARVDFRAPVPLAVPLEVRRRGGTAAVIGPDGPVATVAPLDARLAVGQFGRLFDRDVVRAEAAWLDRRGGEHMAPTCFACGHRRRDRSGLGLRPGPVPESALFAASWNPSPAEPIEPWMIWAALDCPTGVPAMAAVAASEAVVTARLCVEIRDRVRPGGDYQLLSRRVGGGGRKHETEAAIIDEGGRAVAVASALWVTVPLQVMQPELRATAGGR